jgi:AraC-like DNA-binding protein
VRFCQRHGISACGNAHWARRFVRRTPHCFCHVQRPSDRRGLRHSPEDTLREACVHLRDTTAQEAALSRSAFFERFSRAVGVAPIEYLLAWRMAMAKNLLWRKEGGVAEIAERVGYSSASAFSVAFTRHLGLPPSRYARGEMEA